MNKLDCFHQLYPENVLVNSVNESEFLRLMTTQEKSSLTGPETFMVVFSHEKEEDSVKK